MKFKKSIVFLFVFLIIYSVQSLAARQPKITFSVKALFKDRAMIEINGKQHFLSAGEQSPEGVMLLSSNANEANIFCHGEEYTLYINQTAYSGTAVESDKPEFKIPRIVVPGNTVAFKKINLNGMSKYMLKTEYDNPTIMGYGQDSVWVGVGKKLLLFNVKKEAWGEFDLNDELAYKFTGISVSDKSVVLKASKSIKNKIQGGLFLLDKRTSKLHLRLDAQPASFQTIGEQLWFLDAEKGLGYINVKKNHKKKSYKEALLNKDKDKEKDKSDNKKKKKKKNNERAYILSANGDDIWYSHYSKFKKDDKNHRLNEACVSRYNKKHKTFARFTRKEMGLNAKINCSYLAVTDDQVWVSHGRSEYGLSVFNTASKQWKHVLMSANGMLVGGNKIMLDKNQLFMMSGKQLIGLDTKTLYAKVVFGDAVIKNYWQSIFYVKNGYAWYVTKESHNKKPVKSKLVLYKAPI